MKTVSLRTIMAALLLFGAAASVPSCAAMRSRPVQNGYTRDIAETHQDIPVAQLLYGAQTAFRNLNLRDVRVDTTRIDGRFSGESALGTKFVVIVKPIEQNSSYIELWSGGNRDGRIRDHLYSEIISQAYTGHTARK